MRAIHAVTSLWSEAWRLVCLAGWKWARSSMQRQHGPNHPDMPLVVMAIARLERRK